MTTLVNFIVNRARFIYLKIKWSRVDRLESGKMLVYVGRNLYVPEEKIYEHALNHAKEDTYAIGLTLSDFQHVIDVVLYNEERFKALRYNELPLKYVGEVDLVPQSVEVEGT